MFKNINIQQRTHYIHKLNATHMMPGATLCIETGDRKHNSRTHHTQQLTATQNVRTHTCDTHIKWEINTKQRNTCGTYT